MRKCKHLPVGSKIGAWTVIAHEWLEEGIGVRGPYARMQYLCRCDNGHERHIRTDTAQKRLKYGGIRCLLCEKAKHGLSYRERKNLCQVWRNMVTRCTYPGGTGWDRYGAAGITVCDEWRDWPTFRDWAIANGYRPGLQIDRIDGTGPYSPKNCRWVTPRENANNRRNNQMVEAFGETKTVMQWVLDERCMCQYQALWGRIFKSRWEPERAITTPTSRR